MAGRNAQANADRRDGRSWTTNGCPTGKRAYATKAAAKDARRWFQRRGGDLLSAYRCEHCSCFHLGHIPDAVRRGDISRGDYYGGREAA